MTTIDAMEAGQQFQDLLSRAAAGEKIMIVRMGQPEVVLGPLEETEEERITRLKASIARMKKLRDEGGPTLGPGLTIQQLRDEGRR